MQNVLFSVSDPQTFNILDVTLFYSECFRRPFGIQTDLSAQILYILDELNYNSARTELKLKSKQN